MNQYANTGTMVSATMVEPTMAKTTVSANGRKSSPAMPSTNRIGTNTMTVTTVEEITADETSPVALVMVLAFDSPLGACLRCRMMFSMTTIESPTMRPMVIIKPASDIKLTVVPAASMPTNGNSTDSGMVIPVMMVGRIDNRKTNITSTARARPHGPSLARPAIASSMNSAWSTATVNSVPEPICC